MSVSLDWICFNHDKASPDALHIRRNLTSTLDWFEWQQGQSTKHTDSRAAYAIEDVRKNGRKIVIWARFSASEGIKKAKIRAITVSPVSSPPTDLPGCLKVVGKALSKLVRRTANILGEVPEQWVDLTPDGHCSFLTLNDPPFLYTGVGLHYITWKWQYKLNESDKWQDLETTRHLIYVVLDIPTDPWFHSSIENQDKYRLFPWTDVLDYACTWAEGATDVDTAAKMITEAVNNLGYHVPLGSSPSTTRVTPGPLIYDSKGGGGSHYTNGSFYLTEFIDRLNGGQGLGNLVNCDDCAAIVSTFANILGCDLWQCFFALGRPWDGSSKFVINPVILIGTNDWTPPGNEWEYHRAAWYGDWGANGLVFDACLKVDGDGDPTKFPHKPVLPANMGFVEYIFRLTAPVQKGQQKVVTQQQYHKRRPISLTPAKTKP